ncbi:MAG: GNAT family N-acetyltransferase [Fimbriiglobus sp.]
MNRIIRPATPADLPVLLDFNARLAYETEGKTLDEAILTRGILAVFADPHKGFYTLVEEAGIIVGQCMVTFEWSDWRNGYYWWIQSVYVRAEARRTGVFSSLYEHVQRQACAAPDVIGLRLYVERDNTRAQATYTKLGMTDEGYHLMGQYPLPGRSSAIGQG